MKELNFEKSYGPERPYTVINIGARIHHMAKKPRFFFFFKDFIYFFRERGREGETESNIIAWLLLTCPHLVTWPTTQACALTGN